MPAAGKVRGRFISIEGGEGVGKSLFQAKLAEALQAILAPRQLTLVKTREPGGTPTADRIRAVFGAPPADDPLLMKTEALLVSAARAQHVGKRLQPALTAGDWVLCDRFADSTRVYQGMLGGLPEAELEQLIAFSTGRLEPDLTFLLECEVSVSMARLAGRGQVQGDAIERYDAARASFHEKLRQAYLALVGKFPQRFVRLDAAATPETLVKIAMQHIEERFFANA